MTIDDRLRQHAEALDTGIALDAATLDPSRLPSLAPESRRPRALLVLTGVGLVASLLVVAGLVRWNSSEQVVAPAPAASQGTSPSSADLGAPTAAGVPEGDAGLDPPTFERGPVGDRVTSFWSLDELLFGSQLVVVAKPVPSGAVRTDLVDGGFGNRHTVVSMEVSDVLLGDAKIAGQVIEVVAGAPVVASTQYPDGELLAADTSFILFAREFCFDKEEPTGLWALLGPEGVYMQLNAADDPERFHSIGHPDTPETLPDVLSAEDVRAELSDGLSVWEERVSWARDILWCSVRDTGAFSAPTGGPGQPSEAEGSPFEFADEVMARTEVVLPEGATLGGPLTDGSIASSAVTSDGVSAFDTWVYTNPDSRDEGGWPGLLVASASSADAQVLNGEFGPAISSSGALASSRLLSEQGPGTQSSYDDSEIVVRSSLTADPEVWVGSVASGRRVLPAFWLGESLVVSESGDGGAGGAATLLVDGPGSSAWRIEGALPIDASDDETALAVLHTSDSFVSTVRIIDVLTGETLRESAPLDASVFAAGEWSGGTIVLPANATVQVIDAETLDVTEVLSGDFGDNEFVRRAALEPGDDDAVYAVVDTYGLRWTRRFVRCTDRCDDVLAESSKASGVPLPIARKQPGGG